MRTRLPRQAALLVGLLAAGVMLAGCDASGDAAETMQVAMPEGFPVLPVPSYAPLTPERVALGRRLFHDPLLSGDRTVSCASCHRADRAFTDGEAVSTGVRGGQTLRNAPSLLNVAYRRQLFHDGGAPTLEVQALAPLEAEDEMDIPLDTVLARLRAHPDYAARFRAAFGTEGVTVRTLTRALAAFERTLVSTPMAYDRARAGDSSGLSMAARRGLRLFAGRAGCAACHAGPLLTNDAFLDNGLDRVTTGPRADSGRARITLDRADAYRFRVPSLRALARTAPYGHDGRFATLEAVVAHYDRGGHGQPGQDPRVRPLHLTAAERADLTVFLQTLTD